MSNLLFALWMGLSAGLLLLFFYAAYLNWRNRKPGNVELGELIPAFLPVNVEALAELAGPADQPRLQGECSPEEFRRLQRTRVRKTSECLRRMAHNAALLQRLGYAQLHSPNPLICSLAQEMIDAGVQVRFFTFVGLIRLRLRGRLQAMQLSRLNKLGDVQGLLSSELIPAYDLLKDKAGNLTCLKFSSLREELAQSL
jgi:hypothetical protein